MLGFRVDTSPLVVHPADLELSRHVIWQMHGPYTGHIWSVRSALDNAHCQTIRQTICLPCTVVLTGAMLSR